MKKQQESLNKKALGVIIALIAAISVIMGVVVYFLDLYPATDDKSYSVQGNYGVFTASYGDGVTAYEPSVVCDTGLIFYPESKVEAIAYQPLLHSLAGKGVLCILVEMPMNSAFLGKNSAVGMNYRYPEVSRWYIGGHGDSAKTAAAFAKDNLTLISGVVMLGGYSSADLSGTPLDVISVYGSNDGILNMKAYEKSKTGLPAGYNEYIINGGCHTYFAANELRSGDGTPEISFEEQITAAVDYIYSGMTD